MGTYEQDTERARRLAKAASAAIYIPNNDRIWDMTSDGRRELAQNAALASIAQTLIVLTDVLESALLH
jgi:hypothetical protein